MLSTALSYARAGLAVLPLAWILPGGKCSCGKEKKCKPGKHPINHDGVSGATTDPEQVRAWWTRNPQANIGIAGGAVSGGLYWCDFDEEADRVFPAWQATLAASYPALAALPFAVVQTGRGYRVAWRVSGGGELKTEHLARAEATEAFPKGALLVESRADGGYGVAPPSIHENGRTFTLLSGDLCDLPVITPENHARLLRVVKTFHVYQPAPIPVPMHIVRGGALGPSVRPVVRKSGPEVDWSELWQRLDLSAIASLLGELEPRSRSRYVECRCPACGEGPAFVYPSNGQQGVTIRCNRKNHCAYEKTLLQFLTDRLGTTTAAVARLLDAAGMDRAPLSPFSGDRSGVSLDEETAPRIVPGGQAADVYVCSASGGWSGPDVQTMPAGVCASCHWEGVPLATEGPEARCVLCHAADRRLLDQAAPLACQVFCESSIARPERFEPGGMLSCPDCAARIALGKARRAQRSGEGVRIQAAS